MEAALGCHEGEKFLPSKIPVPFPLAEIYGGEQENLLVIAERDGWGC